MRFRTGFWGGGVGDAGGCWGEKNVGVRVLGAPAAAKIWSINDGKNANEE